MEYQLKEDNGFEYIEHGNGPTLILLHGLFGALSNFKDLFSHFEKNYKVVIPKLPIYSLSLIDTAVKSLAKFVHEFIEYKNYKDVILLGNSLGGHVGLVYTTKHPEKVKNLVLTGSSGLYESAFGSSFPRREDYNYIKERVGLTFYNPEHASKELVDEVFEIVGDRNKLLRILALAKSATRHNMKDDLHAITQPTCLIWGKQDTITPPEVAVEFNALIKNSDLFWIDKCGHAAMMEQPEEFNKVLGEWLSKNNK